jgi:signal transduction histidine kinase
VSTSWNASEKLASVSATGSPGLAQASTLIDAARQGVNDALAQLRDLARGVHPPILDQGLDMALSTLAA